MTLLQIRDPNSRKLNPAPATGTIGQALDPESERFDAGRKQPDCFTALIEVLSTISKGGLER